MMAALPVRSAPKTRTAGVRVAAAAIDGWA
jgi:hypothetical protein